MPNSGYHFVNWSDGITTATRTDTNVTASKSLTANFAANTSAYTLTYGAGSGGIISGTSPQTVAANGSGTSVTAVPSSGYHFVNWSDGITHSHPDRHQRDREQERHGDVRDQCPRHHLHAHVHSRARRVPSSD